MKDIFPESTPCCSDKFAQCSDFIACNTAERALRRYVAGDEMPPLTPEQREELLADADYCGEGSFPREEAKDFSDKDLAKWTLDAWLEYARSNCGW